MAVDTRDERGAAIGFLHPWQPTLPLADNSVDEVDRPQVVAAWPGILSGAPVLPTYKHVTYITRSVIKR